MTGTLQLDLFGEVELHEEQGEIEALRARYGKLEDWAARFALGVVKLGRGPARTGWVCPDPYCQGVEVQPWLLALGHGYHPGIAGWAPRDGRCFGVRHIERCSHFVENVRPGPDGTLLGDCWCKRVNSFMATSGAGLAGLVNEHRVHVTRVKPPLSEWRGWR